MNRRKPRLDVAVVPVEAGQDRQAAVLRKAGRAALAALGAQGAAQVAFAAGYLMGFARHQGLKHGIDAEQDKGLALLADLVTLAPDELKPALRGLGLAPRQTPSSRATLGAAEPLADAGYLVGHLESLCGTRRLLWSGGEVSAYLTACDQAADRVQTHHPTAVLRFDAAERAVLRAALANP